MIPSVLATCSICGRGVEGDMECRAHFTARIAELERELDKARQRDENARDHIERIIEKHAATDVFVEALEKDRFELMGFAQQCADIPCQCNWARENLNLRTLSCTSCAAKHVLDGKVPT